MRHFTLLIVTVLVGISIAVPADSAKPTTAARESLDLLLIESSRPARLRLQVEVDGKSIVAVWNESFSKLFSFHDHNEDGFLDKNEAKNLPSSFALRQGLWGQFSPFRGEAPLWKELDINSDEKITKEELIEYYRRTGLGGVIVGVGKTTVTARLTEAILTFLDTNKDGKVTEPEWKVAAEVLRKLDSNDDELIGPGELVENALYPGALGANLLTSPRAGVKPNPIVDDFPLTVLPYRVTDTYWEKAVAPRRAAAKQSPISADGLDKLPIMETWQVGFNLMEKEPPVLRVSAKTANGGTRLNCTHENFRLELRGDSGKLPAQISIACKRFLDRFADCDRNTDEVLDAEELAAPKAVQLRQLCNFCDRNGDGKLSRKELDAWLSLQRQIVKGHVLLSVIDHGAGLFELLDADHDGSLSVRELRTAWDRLHKAKCVRGGVVERGKLPRHLLACISHGHSQSLVGKAARTGPEWFQAMDRNGDGDISPREFTGTKETFKKIDTDGDGLIDTKEASRIGNKK